MQRKKKSCRFLKIKSFYKTAGPISRGKDENSNTHSHQTDKVDVWSGLSLRLVGTEANRRMYVLSAEDNHASGSTITAMEEYKLSATTYSDFSREAQNLIFRCWQQKF